MNKIIVNETEEGRNIAVLENGKLVELYEEENERKLLDGNIYCGIVRNILPGMQSAFVDINERKNAFLHIKDVIPKVSNETGNKCEKMEKYNINDYLRVKKPILVQVKKEEEHQKGAKVSTNINLAGRYLIFTPGAEFITISQKISDKNEIERLKNILKTVVEKNNLKSLGIIIRTSAQGISEEEIKNDFNKLIVLWEKIFEKFEECKQQGVPIKIYEAANTLQKIIIGTVNSNKYEIDVDSENVKEEINAILNGLNITNVIVKKVEGDILESYELKKQIENSKNRKVWLKSGGFITIDKTEALTAIDVNTGKFVGKKNNTKDETIFDVNKEATIEIAKQLRLKNISGIIVIDYIDMEKEEERDLLKKILEKELKKDRSKTQIMGFTKLDLLEMTRKKL